MFVKRVLVAASLAAAALTATPAAAQDPCTKNPENCYECVMYPCYPRDWPPFLLDKVNEVIGNEGHVDVNPPVVCVQEPCDQKPLVEACVYRLEMCTA